MIVVRWMFGLLGVASVVLGGFFNVVSFVIHLLNSAYETAESPFVPIEPSSE